MAVTSEELRFIMTMRDEATKVLNRHRRELGDTGRDAREASGRIGEVGAALRDAAAAFGAFTAGSAAMRATVGEFMAVEDAMIAVEKTTGMAGAELEDFKARFMDMAASSAVPKEELGQIATVAGQLGIQGADDIITFTETVAKMGTATDLAGEEAAVALSRMLGVMKEDISEVGRLGSVIVQLGNNIKGTESEIANMALEMSRTTQMFELGTTAVSGMAAALVETGARSESASTAIGRVFQQINLSIQEGGAAAQKLSRLTGIALADLKQSFEQDAMNVFMRFVEGLRLAQDEGTNLVDILKMMSLNQQETIRDFLPLIGNLERFKEVMGLANLEAQEQTALNKEYEKANEALSKQLAQASNAAQVLGATVGGALAPALKEMAATVTDGLNALRVEFQALPDDVQTAIAALTAFGATGVGVLTGIRALAGAVRLLNIRLPTVAGTTATVRTAMAALTTTAGGMTAALSAGLLVLGYYAVEEMKFLRSLEQANATMREARAETATLTAAVDGFVAASENLDGATFDQLKEGAQAAREKLEGLTKEHAALQQRLSDPENLTDAQFVALNLQAAKTKQAIERLNGAVFNYNDALKDAKEAEEVKAGSSQKSIDMLNLELAALRKGAEAYQALTREKQVMAMVDERLKELGETRQSIGAENIAALQEEARETLKLREQRQAAIDELKANQEEAKEVYKEALEARKRELLGALQYELDKTREHYDGLIKAAGDNQEMILVLQQQKYEALTKIRDEYNSRAVEEARDATDRIIREFGRLPPATEDVGRQIADSLGQGAEDGADRAANAVKKVYEEVNMISNRVKGEALNHGYTVGGFNWETGEVASVRNPQGELVYSPREIRRATQGTAYARRALGGDFMANKPLLVGEQGPELLYPSKAGTVVPNHKMGGDVSLTVNVNAGDGDAAAIKDSVVQGVVEAINRAGLMGKPLLNADALGRDTSTMRFG
jgi:TP901 family phage tail tape measure protein